MSQDHGQGKGVNNTLYSTDEDETLDGGRKDDTYIFTDNFGHDRLIDAHGTDTLDFSALTDSIYYNNAMVTAGSSQATWDKSTTYFERVIGGGNDDVMYGGAQSDSLYGGVGDDTLNGAGGDDYLEGNQGDDHLTGEAGNDTLLGGAGDDWFAENVSTGNDVYDGGSGTDTIDYSISGQIARLAVTADGLQVHMNGFTDSLSNIEVIRGSAANRYDQVTAAGATQAVEINLKAGTLTVGDQAYTVENFETAHGSIYDDTLVGDDGDNGLGGDAGNDTYFGGLGNDTIYDSAGDDTYVFDDFFGHDTLTDKGGVNTLSFSQATQDLFYHAQGRTAVVGASDVTWSSGVNFAAVLGGSGNDRLLGFVLDDYLSGNAGDDSLSGSVGNDTLVGGTGNDTLIGGRGDDVYRFNGGDGQDVINDTAAWPGSFDTLQFGDVVSSSDVAFWMNGSQLEVGLVGTSDQVTILDHASYLGSIERFELSDGFFLTAEDINSLVQAMSQAAADQGVVLDSLADVQNNAELMALTTAAWHA